MDASPAPDLAVSGKPPPPAFVDDSLWRRAMTEKDDIDLASLADREGASGLLNAVEQGGDVGRTALKALPYAHDAPVALGRLAELSLLTREASQLMVIQTILEIALTRPAFGEPVDEGGRQACTMALLHIARDEKSADRSRALAISALRLPAFVEVLGTHELPTKFDSPAPSSSLPQR
ncbi:MAG: hypothetical protein CSA75_00545 [Sorangium cellulosum]|nr:MAG: hypothetical protein CSA75_00545 [Sorangium cellulosum]